jgi:hypothetical protein
MMDHFYLSRHGSVVYLVERAQDMAVPCGHVVRRLA